MRYLTCVLLFACGTSPALAQTAPSGPLPDPAEVNARDTITVAAGVGIVPDYEGSDDYRIIPVGALRGRYRGFAFTTRGSYLYVDVVPRGSGKLDFEFGPVVGARFNSRKHIDDQVVKLLPNLKTAFEIGAFAGVGYNGLTNPYDRLSFRVDVLHDVGSAHESTVISPNIEFSTPVSQTTYVGASVGAEFVSNKFADYYFSISPADSLDTAGVLPVFNADGGLKNWKANLLVNQSLSGSLLHGLSIFGLGQYSRLVGDFKRSPIVSQRGSSSQWIGALGLAYTW